MRTVINQYNYIMSSLLKEKEINSFEIKKEVIPKGTVLNLYDRKRREIFKGEYLFDYPIIALQENGEMWMSDSQLEIEAIAGAVEMAKGDVLIGGLGIGLLPTFIKNKRSIRKIDIVEKYPEVIELVFNQIASRKMQIIQDDIFHYLDVTSNKYDFIHIDIWDNIYAPIREIDNARDKAKRCLNPGGIIWCWLQELYDRIKEKLPREPTWVTGAVGYHRPCLICSKTFRNDYAGLCMDCADALELSEYFLGEK